MALGEIKFYKRPASSIIFGIVPVILFKSAGSNEISFPGMYEQIILASFNAFVDFCQKTTTQQ
jgi:hypothetical protein